MKGKPWIENLSASSVCIYTKDLIQAEQPISRCNKAFHLLGEKGTFGEFRWFLRSQKDHCDNLLQFLHGIPFTDFTDKPNNGCEPHHLLKRDRDTHPILSQGHNGGESTASLQIIPVMKLSS